MKKCLLCYHKIMNKFSKRISSAIKQSGKTQKQIAQALNISEGNITNWKKGTNQPSIEILYQLCLIIDESADYLLGLEDESGRKTYANNNYNNYTNYGNM